MKMTDVGYLEETIESLMKAPLLRDNIKNLEKDFELVFADLFAQDFPEQTTEADLLRFKSDLFASFCYGAQVGVRTDSRFRLGFNLPKEFMPTEKKEPEKPRIIIP